MKNSLYVTAAVAFLVFPGIAGADAVADIQAASQEFESAMSAGDADRLAELYTEDAIVMPAGMPRVEGRDAVRDLFQGYFDEGVSDPQLTSAEVEVFNDTAIQIGTYQISFPGEDGSELTETGKFLEVWKQDDDGNWRIHRDIWNADGPPE